MKLKVTDYLSLNLSLFTLKTKSKYLSVVALEVHSDRLFLWAIDLFIQVFHRTNLMSHDCYAEEQFIW